MNNADSSARALPLFLEFLSSNRLVQIAHKSAMFILPWVDFFGLFGIHKEAALPPSDELIREFSYATSLLLPRV